MAVQAADNLPDFRNIADAGHIIQETMPYRRNQTTSIALQRTGYLAALSGILTLVFTTAATGTYANKTAGIPTPENCIREIRLRSNSGYVFAKLSGFDLMLMNRVQKLYDYRNPVTTFDGAANGNRVFVLPSSYTTSTQYTIKMPVFLKPVLGDRELLSLILLESKGTIYLDIDWDDIESNLLTMGGTTPSITVNSVTFTPEADVFLTPQVPHNPPNLSPVHTYISQVDAITNTGTDKFYPLNGGTLLRAIVYYQNGNGDRIAASNFGNYRLNFGGIMQPVVGSIDNLLARNQRDYEGYNLPSGVWVHDFLQGNGDGSRQPGLRDSVPLRDAKDLSIEHDILSSLTLTAGAKRTVILELLKPANVI